MTLPPLAGVDPPIPLILPVNTPVLVFGSAYGTNAAYQVLNDGPTDVYVTQTNSTTGDLVGDRIPPGDTTTHSYVLDGSVYLYTKGGVNGNSGSTPGHAVVTAPTPYLTVDTLAAAAAAIGLLAAASGGVHLLLPASDAGVPAAATIRIPVSRNLRGLALSGGPAGSVGAATVQLWRAGVTSGLGTMTISTPGTDSNAVATGQAVLAGDYLLVTPASGNASDLWLYEKN